MSRLSGPDAGRLHSGGIRGGVAPDVSGHAIAVTLVWVALATGFGVLAAVPLTRAVLAARRASPMPPRLSG